MHPADENIVLARSKKLKALKILPAFLRFVVIDPVLLRN